MRLDNLLSRRRDLTSSNVILSSDVQMNRTIWHASITINGVPYEGRGPSKMAAKNRAADMALRALGG